MPRNKTRAVIWDMDGVIADTGPYHLKAWQKVFRKRGVDFTEEDFKGNFGQRNDTIIRNTLGEQITQSEVADIAREKEQTFRNLVRENIPIENIRLVTQSLGIYHCFHAIVSGRDVTEGKPSPQGFLLAAKKLGVEPGQCVVIEDAIAGVAACKRAGAHCLAVTNTHPKEKLKRADLIVDTLEAVKINDLEELLNPP